MRKLSFCMLDPRALKSYAIVRTDPRAWNQFFISNTLISFYNLRSTSTTNFDVVRWAITRTKRNIRGLYWVFWIEGIIRDLLYKTCSFLNLFNINKPCRCNFIFSVLVHWVQLILLAPKFLFSIGMFLTRWAHHVDVHDLLVYLNWTRIFLLQFLQVVAPLHMQGQSLDPNKYLLMVFINILLLSFLDYTLKSFVDPVTQHVPFAWWGISNSTLHIIVLELNYLLVNTRFVIKGLFYVTILLPTLLIATSCHCRLFLLVQLLDNSSNQKVFVNVSVSV